MLYQSCWNNLVTGLIVPSSLLQFVNSLFQTCSNKFGTSSANTSCQQLANRLVTTCLQVCSNLCVFTCVCVNTKILSCVLIARSISVEIKTCLQYILYTMPRPYPAHDLRWRMVFKDYFIKGGIKK